MGAGEALPGEEKVDEDPAGARLIITIRRSGHVLAH